MTTKQQLEQVAETRQYQLDVQKQTLEHIEKVKSVTKVWDWMSLVVAVFVGWMLREVIVHEPQLWAHAGVGMGCLFIAVAQVLNQRRLKEACEMFHVVFMPHDEKNAEENEG